MTSSPPPQSSSSHTDRHAKLTEKTSKCPARLPTRRSRVSSILLWIRTDQPRQQRMDYWKGPYSKIISPAPGFNEYRQIHLAETIPGLWPATAGGPQPAILADRRTMASPRSPSPPAGTTSPPRLRWTAPAPSCSSAAATVSARRSSEGSPTSNSLPPSPTLEC